MFTITTTQTSNKSGTAVVIAKGHGKQRTTRLDHAKSAEVNAGEAAANLLDVLMSAEQRAKVLHPSGAQRCTARSMSDAGGKYRFTIDV